MVERDEVVSIERQMRELTESTLATARERAMLEASIMEARKTLERAKVELPVAERAAKERRQMQVDAIRGRAELERRLNDLVESEGLARTRRQQAEQKAQGFKAAAAFSSMARTEAEAGGDGARAERERMVEDRALREGANAEARASEERAEENRIGKLRAEVAGHVAAEREVEAAIAVEREDFENRVTALRADIERAGFELHEAEVNLARLDADRERLATERNAADEKLREVSKRARLEIESRIAELRSAEADLARERGEQERLLAALLENEKRAERDRKNAEKAELKKIEAERAAAKAEADRVLAEKEAVAQAAAESAARAAAKIIADVHEVVASDHASAHDEPKKNGRSGSILGPIPVNGKAFDFSSLGEISDEEIQAQVDKHALEDEIAAKNAYAKRKEERAALHVDEDAPDDALTQYKRSLAASEASRGFVAGAEEQDEELIPGFRSFIGNIFTRAKSTRPDAPEEEREDPPESASIADRIARDFGLLGGNDTAPPPFHAPRHESNDGGTH